MIRWRMCWTVLALSGLLPGWTSWSATEGRPNLLWVSCEDISPHLGCYGDPHARTPHLDALAKEGVRYTHAFATAGVCAPCRSAVITGLYQTSLGTHHMRCNARLPDYLKPFPVLLRQAGYYCTNNSKKDYQFKEPAGTWDESNGRAHWRNRSDPAQPFFAVFNFTECHESGIANDAKYEKVTAGQTLQDPAKLTTLPPYYPDTPVVRRDWARNYDVITAMDKRVGEVLKQLKEDGLYEDTIIVFWSDHGVGLPRAKRWLYDSGLRVPLLVRIPEKYRSPGQGEPGAVSDRLVSLLDLGPTMLHLAGVPVPQTMHGRPFLGAHPAPRREYIYGARDRMDERYDIIRAVRDRRFKYIRNYEPFKTYYQYMNTPEKGRTMQEIRRLQETGGLPETAALYTVPSKPVEELYDTETDPHEIRNLAAHPDFQGVLQRLRQAHLDWVSETRDLGLLPEAEIVEREKRVGNRYEILRQRDGEPFGQRLRAMSNRALGGAENREFLEQGLGDPDAAIRYWAAVGLGNLGEPARASLPRLRERLADDSASVRLAAARALARLDLPEEALPVLRRELASSEEWVRLGAAIELDEMDDAARPAIPDLKTALKDRENKYVVRVANRALNEMLGLHHQVP